MRIEETPRGMSTVNDIAPPTTDPSTNPDCECPKKNIIMRLRSFMDTLMPLPFQSIVAIVLILILIGQTILLNFMYLYYIFVPVDAKVAVNMLNKDSKDYQYVTQVQAPLTIRNFYTVFKGLADSYTSINLKIFALIAILIILMSLVVLGSELIKKKDARHMVGILYSSVVLVYGLLLLSMAVYIYNSSARKITSQGTGNMYTNFDNYVASRILTKATNSSNTSNFLNPFKTSSGSLYMQQDQIIQQALTILGSNPPAVGERSVFDADSSKWSGVSQPDIFNIASTAIASAEATAAAAAAASSATTATTTATAAPAAPAAAAAATGPSQDDNATTVAQALFTINMFLVYCDSKLTDTQNRAFTDLFSSANYLSNTAPAFSAYLFRKYVAISDRASIYKDDPAFDQFTVAGKRQGVALYQKWVREASNQYANFYPEEYYASVRNRLIIFVIVNMVLLYVIGVLSIYLSDIANMMEAAKQVASVIQGITTAEK